jgi:hypothetical protein
LNEMLLIILGVVENGTLVNSAYENSLPVTLTL